MYLTCICAHVCTMCHVGGPTGCNPDYCDALLGCLAALQYRQRNTFLYIKYVPNRATGEAGVQIVAPCTQYGAPYTSFLVRKL